MAKRYSKAFFAGGVATLLLMLAVLAFAHMVLGMSDSAVSDSGFMENLAAFLLCAYFFVSAWGVSVSKTNRASWGWAIVAHLIIVIAYILIFVSEKRNASDINQWRSDMTKLGLFMAVFFTPWILVWRMVLLKGDRNIPGP